jgi:uncharacterized protein with PIN domain
MMITQHTFGVPNIQGISVKVVRHDHAVRYTATIKLEFDKGQTQMVSVASDNLEALIPKIDLCPICNIELQERELVAMGNAYPMANPNVDDYENLPF